MTYIFNVDVYAEGSKSTGIPTTEHIWGTRWQGG